MDRNFDSHNRPRLTIVSRDVGNASASVKILLRRRNLFESAYYFSSEGIIDMFRSVIDLTSPAPIVPVKLMVITSLERTIATLISKNERLIVFDLGFLELVSDFCINFMGLHNHVRLRRGDEQASPGARLSFSQAETEAIRRRVREELGEIWEFEPLDSDEGDDEDTGPEPDLTDEFDITGSQIFRDATCRLVETGLGSHYDKATFEAFCLWPHRVDEAQYRVGPLLANHLLHSPRVEERLAQIYGSIIASSALQLLCHEYAHCLFTRFSIEHWQTTREFADIRQEMPLLAQAVGTNLGLRLDALEELGSDPALWPERVKRAASEAFFDLRSIQMIVQSQSIPRDEGLARNFFASLIASTVRNVALMILRDAVSEDVLSRKAMNQRAALALRETLQRGAIVAASVIRLYRYNFPSGRVELLYEEFAECMRIVTRLTEFYMADHSNNLPSLPYEGEPWHEFEERAWRQFMTYVTRPSGP